LKNNHIVIALLSAGTLASCTDRDVAMTPAAKQTVIEASINEAGRATRSAIDPTEYADGAVGIVWTPEDCLGVFSESTLNARFANADNLKAGRVRFKGDIAGTPLYAYYPYSEVNNNQNADNLYGTLPLSQQWDANTQEIAGDYKYGTPRDGAENEFDFTHLFSLLRFSINASGTEIEGDMLRSVSMQLPSGRVLGGDFTFSAVNGEYQFNATAAPDANVITLNWSSPLTLAAGTTATGYMSCAPDIKEDDKLTITVTTDRRTATFTAQARFAFEAGAIYTFNLNLSEIADRFELKVEQLPEEQEEETANCYMITTAGEHDFKATVIGNGEKGIIKGAGFHTEDPYINPASAKLLWEDVQGFISDVRLVDGRVHYNATGNVGNAVIAVYSGTDGKGDILWSWHIWGVGDTLPQDEEITNRNGNIFSVMNRTLGSRSDHPGYATLYQWGRKDPFPNEDTIYVNGEETSTYTTVDYYRRYYNVINFDSSNSSEATIAGSVKNPVSYFDLGKNLSNNDWLVEENNYLWGNTMTKDENSTTQTSQSHGKTIYDPSPVGYRVPNCYTFTFFSKHDGGSNQSVGNTRIDWINFAKYEDGYYFMRDENDTEGTLFPMCGDRGGYYGAIHSYTGNGAKRVFTSNVDITADYWYSNAATGSNAMHLYLTKYVEFNTGSTSTNSNNGINVYYTSARRTACAVRCVRE